MAIEHLTDYETRGPEQLIERYRKPHVVALLASWLSELQHAEDALWQLLTERSVATAVGAQLDVLGRIVQEPRRGRLDVTYRVWVAAKILVLRSLGKPEQLIAIVRKLLGPSVVVRYEEHYPAALMLHAVTPIHEAVGTEVARLLAVAKAAGVAAQFEWFSSLTGGEAFTFAPGNTSVFSSSMGFDEGAFSAVSDGTVNVPFASTVPTSVLLFDGDNDVLTFDGDNDYLTLG